MGRVIKMFDYNDPVRALEQLKNMQTPCGNAQPQPLERYEIDSKGVKTIVEISKRSRLPYYKVLLPEIGIATTALLYALKERLLDSFELNNIELFDPAMLEDLKKEFTKEAGNMLSQELPNLDTQTGNYLLLTLQNEIFGLGSIQLLLEDNAVEEIVVNSIKEPVRVYHKKYGWMKTNIGINSENDILNHAHRIARRVGREITNLNPRLDAYLISGDRVNALLNPISMKGHTITIRKFARDPWTAIDFINNRTISLEAVALIWLAVQQEMNMIISGGTGSGKTSFLNICMPFVPPNHRIVSIEDTRELQLPEFLYWCPMITREANPEGKGEVSMLDLLVNALRMRPDRIVMGEIRKQKEAEVLFEAMHTGHSVYSTLHANTCAQTISRLTNPPINIPHSMLDAVHMNVVLLRDRRTGQRRVYEIGEFTEKTKDSDDVRYIPRIIYKWDPIDDVLKPQTEEVAFYEKISAYTGMTNGDIALDICGKQDILSWLIKRNIRHVEAVGNILNHYYTDPGEVIDAARSDSDPQEIISESPGLQEV
jgi:flagellar protein FlaI